MRRLFDDYQYVKAYNKKVRAMGFDWLCLTFLGWRV